MIDYSRAYTAEWHLYRVNRETWADGPEVATLVSATVTHETDGDAPEVDSGTLEVRMPAPAEWEPGYYRLAMRAIQGGIERVDVATFLCESDGGTIDYGADAVSVTGRSVLHPAAVTHVRIGDFCTSGQDAAAKVGEMLSECIEAPISVEGSFALSDHYNFEVGQPVLEAAWMLLKAGGFCMWPDGRGVVHIAPLPTEPSLSLNRANARLVSPQVQHSLDWSQVPNRYTADDNGTMAVAANDDPSSPSSHATRGYWHDEYDSSPAMLDGEGLAAYAQRMLEEMSTLDDARTYTRRFADDVHAFSMVEGALPNSGLSGLMRVKSQSLDCSNGIQVTETAAREVKAWTRTASLS